MNVRMNEQFLNSKAGGIALFCEDRGKILVRPKPYSRHIKDAFLKCDSWSKHCCIEEAPPSTRGVRSY